MRDSLNIYAFVSYFQYSFRNVWYRLIRTGLFYRYCSMYRTPHSVVTMPRKRRQQSQVPSCFIEVSSQDILSRPSIFRHMRMNNFGHGCQLCLYSRSGRRLRLVRVPNGRRGTIYSSRGLRFSTCSTYLFTINMYMFIIWPHSGE